MIRHWSINGRFLTQPVTGVQRYATEIVQALDEQIVEGHPLARDLAVRLIVPKRARKLHLKAIRLVEAGSFAGHMWEQSVLPFRVKGGLLSLGNVGPVAVRHQIVCMHDVNTREFPQSYSRSFRLIQRILLPILGKSVSTISTVSAYSAEQLGRQGIREQAKILVIPNGHEHVTRSPPRSSAATRRVSGPGTIVMIGTPAPHKNLGLILGLADRLVAVGLRITIVGQRDEKVYRAAGLDIGSDNVTWLGRISDPELAALLQDCLCLAFPSFVEGFGLPPLEAMALGCPVVVSDRASLPEICGDAALYAAPDDPDAWLAQFSRLRRDRMLRRDLVRRGRERAGSFSWAASAQLYLAAMSTADATYASVDGRASTSADALAAAPRRNRIAVRHNS